MFRFTIRDVPWLMVVVALVLGWGVDRYKYRHSFQGYNLKYLLECEGWTIYKNKKDGSVEVWKDGTQYGFDPLGNPKGVTHRAIYNQVQGNPISDTEPTSQKALSEKALYPLPPSAISSDSSSPTPQEALWQQQRHSN